MAPLLSMPLNMELVNNKFFLPKFFKPFAENHNILFIFNKSSQMATISRILVHPNCLCVSIPF